jgi:nitrate/nitrite transporter NarK
VTIVNLGFLSGILVVGLPVLGASLAWTSVALFSAIGLVQGASFAAVPELNPSAQARALGYGVMAQTGNIGNLLGTPLLLAVLDRYGEAGMLGLVAVLYMAAVALHLLLAARRRRAGNSVS